MTTPEYLSRPDEHLKASVASGYDSSVSSHFADDVVRPAVALLAELAGSGDAVEFAIGTGRLGLPLSGAGVRVHGIDFSEPMLNELRRKEGADRIDLTVGDMSKTRVCTDAALVYLVFNTIMNLRTQAGQVACFQNAADHLQVGGRFVIECMVPRLHQLPSGEPIRPFKVTPEHLGFEEYIDRVNQITISHHYFIDGERSRSVSGAFRYVWPSELDLMAQLAGMELESRWADWRRTPFTNDSLTHVSVWKKA